MVNQFMLIKFSLIRFCGSRNTFTKNSICFLSLEHNIISKFFSVANICYDVVTLSCDIQFYGI